MSVFKKVEKMRVLLFLLTFIIPLVTYGQRWELVDEKGIPEKGIKDITPLRYAVYHLDDQDMKRRLFNAPEEYVGVKQSTTIITVALLNGESDEFRMVRYSMMEEELENQYPDIRTFHGISTTIPGRKIRIDYTEQGFRAVVTTPDMDKIYIDHFQRGDKEHRVVYRKKDYKLTPTWGCNVDEEFIKSQMKPKDSGERVGDCLFRSYRLAQAATGEYSNYHGATSSAQSGLVLSAVTTGINRINEVYEAEIAVRLILVGNTNQVFYYNPATDPYTASNASTMLGENISTCNTQIGSANYDVGHVFGALGNNGVAYLNAVCGTNKAGGVTTSTQPVNDPFFIDYVAHEMGHQFGGNHTQNNNCNRNNSTAMEPGSASSIMGYAGICAPNVQSNSDAYFHAINLQEIKTFLQSGGGSGCDQFIPNYSNTPPIVTAQPNYSIPKSTPFVLTLAATDPDGDAILYGWDQMNNQTATMPPVATSTTGPAFRSIYFTSSPSRYFPNIATVLAGNTANTWEVVPSVGRTLNFRGVARDFSESSTASCNSEINVVVTTVAAAGPFAVTSQNTATTWLEGQTATVTWNVSGTTDNGINCANVDILMSYDGGLTYPVILANTVSNDGSQDIVVPSGTTSTARFMIKGSGNIFFDVNNANITVDPGGPTFNLSRNPASHTICVGQSKSFTVSVTPVLGFSNPVTLSLPGLPAGYSASFNVNPVLPGNDVILTITNISAPTGTTNQTIQGVSGSITRTVNVSLVSSNDGNLSSPVLSIPANLSTSVSIRPTFNWGAVAGATGYQFQLSRRNDFAVLGADITGLSTPSYAYMQYLEGGSEFFWRVRAVNDCISGPWSMIFMFTTETCYVYSASDLPISISSQGTPTINSYRPVIDKGGITDVDVIQLSGTHSYVDDLRFTLFAPSTNNVRIWDRPCGGDANFNINFNQSASPGTWPCPPTNGGTYQPSNSLNTFNGLSLTGQWRLQVEDLANQDGGSLETWGMKTCVNNFCRLMVDNPFPRGAGSLYDAIQCALDGDTIRFQTNIDNDTIWLADQNLIIAKQIVIECQSQRNIHVMSASEGTLIDNSASSTGLKIKGLHLHGTSNTNAVIVNRGILELEDVFLYRDNASASSSVLNRSGASIVVKGICEEIE